LFAGIAFSSNLLQEHNMHSGTNFGRGFVASGCDTGNFDGFVCVCQSCISILFTLGGTLTRFTDLWACLPLCCHIPTPETENEPGQFRQCNRLNTDTIPLSFSIAMALTVWLAGLVLKTHSSTLHQGKLLYSWPHIQNTANFQGTIFFSTQPWDAATAPLATPTCW